MSATTEPQTARLLVNSPLARVYDVVCTAPRSGYSPMMSNPVIQIGLPRRGVFVMERRGNGVVVDTNRVLMLGLDDDYRLRHPTGDGDAGTVIALPTARAEEAFGRIDGG